MNSKTIAAWKNPIILLVTIGIANIGEWIYFIALNLAVLESSGNNALAVTGLYIMQPLATVLTNFWAGSLIDRLNKRTLLIALNLIRAGVIALLPFFSSLWIVYFIVFTLGSANAVFQPTSMSYITRTLAAAQIKKFNSFRSLIDSGAFLIGPAVAGILLAFGTPNFAILTNAAALFSAGVLTLFLPNVETISEKALHEKLSLNMLKADFKAVQSFSLSYRLIMKIYFSFSGITVMATALDSLEATFSISVLNLSNQEYGFLVSVAGAGILVGSIATVAVADSLSLALMMGGGTLLVSIGYLIYAFSTSFIAASIGFFVLAFSLAFANTGFQSFYQLNIPVDLMGRIGSLYGLVESLFTMIMILLFGITTQFMTLRSIIILGSLGTLSISLILWKASSKKVETNFELID
ncbi:MFS transporter [Carnobacterium mobile]|uniref:MFS transporter n=1 Tax=Carnobacterium mobile TaxID=2750 RepID=UPI00054EA0F0|nr:MFS transporter [Carnobacterium mobile]